MRDILFWLFVIICAPVFVLLIVFLVFFPEHFKHGVLTEKR